MIIVYTCVNIHSKFMLLITEARASTPERVDDEPDIPLDALPLPPSPLGISAQGRQKSSASVQSFDPSPFLAKVSNPPTPSTFDVIRDVRNHYVVPDGVLNPGFISDGYTQTCE